MSYQRLQPNIEGTVPSEFNLDKVLYQNEEVRYFRSPNGMSKSFVLMVVFSVVVVLVVLGYTIPIAIFAPKVAPLLLSFILPVSVMMCVLIIYVNGGRRAWLLTNYRVMQIRSFWNTLHVDSLPYGRIQELIETEKSIQFVPIFPEGFPESYPRKGRTTFTFSDIPIPEMPRIKDLIRLGQTTVIGGLSPPSTIYAHTNLANLNLSPAYQELAAPHTPFQWAHKPSRFSIMKIQLIVNIVVYTWMIGLFLINYSAFGSVGLYIVVVIAALFPLMTLYHLFIFNQLDGFNAISNNAVVLIRTGLKIGRTIEFKLHNATVLPFSSVYPLRSSIDVKTGEGTLFFRSGFQLMMKGPEALVREEIIFKGYIESLGQV
eukprot:TRINITY_DN661_c0_g1_i1.p1 TRINITY_DN661_c0_g1~~TRINITY_DN661_c0_g1_i1.p1  ORF type:complete len:373 (-),score=46.05 TRINITY_DN661_c0_g1_i1:180-1298(-)